MTELQIVTVGRLRRSWANKLSHLSLWQIPWERLGLKSGIHFYAPEVSKMSKSQDKRKESKKPATRTAKEKHQQKKAKQAEHAHREF